VAADSPHEGLRSRPTEFPLRTTGFGFDDFDVGRGFEHIMRRTILESDNALFSTWSLAMVARYLDREAARREGQPDLLVNPWLVFSIVFGLTVEDLSERSAAFLGIEDLRFDHYVHPGDTLRAKSVVTERRRVKSRSAGVVTWRTLGFNQRDQPVISFMRTNLFALEA
jgi:acyl dehydratase